MGDNTILKDGSENSYSLRAVDISAAQDGSLRRTLLYSSLMPPDYAGLGGGYHHTSKSGVIAAGMTVGAPIYAFVNPSASMLALIRRVRLAAWSSAAGFAAGLAIFDMFVARGFTVLDTGGVNPTMTTPQMKLRASHAVPVCQIARANAGALTAGTRTLDLGVIETLVLAAPTSANTPFSPAPVSLIDKKGGEHPLTLAQNEGFVIQGTVPITGTWQFSLGIEWDEVPLVQFKT